MAAAFVSGTFNAFAFAGAGFLFSKINKMDFLMCEECKMKSKKFNWLKTLMIEESKIQEKVDYGILHETMRSRMKDKCYKLIDEILEIKDELGLFDEYMDSLQTRMIDKVIKHPRKINF